MPSNQRVDVSKEEKAQIQRQFVGIVNLLFDEHSVFEDESRTYVSFDHKENRGQVPRPMNESDVKVTQIWSKEEDKLAHLSSKPNDHWNLGIRFSTYPYLSPQNQLFVLIHEATHLIDKTYAPHSKEFYKLMGELVERAAERHKALSSILDWHPRPDGIRGRYLMTVNYSDAPGDTQQLAETIQESMDYPSLQTAKILYRPFENPWSIEMPEESMPSGYEPQDIEIDNLPDMNPDIRDKELLTIVSKNYKGTLSGPNTGVLSFPEWVRVKEKKKENGEVTEYRIENGEKLVVLSAVSGRRKLNCAVKTLGF